MSKHCLIKASIRKFIVSQASARAKVYPHPIYLFITLCMRTNTDTCLADCACALVFGLIGHAHCAFFSWKKKMAVLLVQICVGLKVLKNWGLHPVNELPAGYGWLRWICVS